ncbi:penicillin-binding transpeptidase domain-containing protein [Candidatus Zixiibacteriota bacterium]
MATKQARRTFLIAVLGICIWILLVGKLFSIQILQNDEYRQRGKDQHQRRLILSAQRGEIYDRDGVKLVFNLPVKSYYAVPEEVEDPQRLGQLFGQLLSKPAHHITASLKQKSCFVWLARKMGPVESGLIESWNLSGIYPLEEMERFYPGRCLGSQIIGFADVDNKGLEGIELQFDEQLRGEDGWIVVQMDARGRKIPLLEYPREEPRNGRNLVLTLQASYQAIAEKELERGIQDTKARAGCIILLDPRTGEILAMANEPRYDLNCPGDAPPAWRRNRAVTDLFEPGSTFKIVTATGALGDKVQQPDDLIYCEGGKMAVCGKVIHDVEEHHWLTFQQVIEKSSNVGTIKVARELGQDRLYHYARAFGFGNPTGIDLPGEVKGMLAHPEDWSGMSLASLAIGHEVAVTPIQLICSYAAVANGGTLMKPLIARYILDQRGNVIQKFSPVVVRQVTSPETAASIRLFLTKVVESGTGKLAAVEGLQVAGKTGTAFKVKEDGTGFSNNRFVASFCGFFPAQSPRLVGLVVLDEPKSPHSGGRAAAPIFRRIVEHLLHLPKGPNADLCLKTADEECASEMVVVPDLSGLDKSQALDLLGKRGLAAQQEGDGQRVCHQQPQAGALIARGQTVFMDLCRKSERGKRGSKTPYVVGLTVREAIKELKQSGLTVKISGSGLVVRQNPKAGHMIKEGELCLLECQPPGRGQNLMAVVSHAQ